MHPYLRFGLLGAAMLSLAAALALVGGTRPTAARPATPDLQFASFPVPSHANTLDGITTGPDGNLWFTEADTNLIGRITPAGVIREFGGLTASSSPSGITAGPDGNLWFTESDGNRIGRITPSGVVREFPVLTSS